MSGSGPPADLGNSEQVTQVAKQPAYEPTTPGNMRQFGMTRL